MQRVGGRRKGLAVMAAAALVAMGVAGGCTDDRPPERPKTTGSHVWRGQTDLLFEAKDQARDIDAQAGAKEAAIERARRGD